MSHTNLANYFKTQYQLVRHFAGHEEIENMMIFEKDIYTTMFIEEKRNQT